MNMKQLEKGVNYFKGLSKKEIAKAIKTFELNQHRHMGFIGFELENVQVIVDHRGEYVAYADVTRIEEEERHTYQGCQYPFGCLMYYIGA